MADHLTRTPLHRLLTGLAAGGIVLTAPARAEPTAITIRVIAADAKFVGDHTGGARITLRDNSSGRVLGSGVTSGGTGETDRIMKATGRSPLRASSDAAAFSTVLDIERPTLVDLEAEGPLARPGSHVKVTVQRWVMPGTPVTAGDGWTVELPGLAITPAVKIEAGKIHINAKVEPMCGCPITPGGVWDAADYRVTASLWSGNRRLSSTDLAFAHAPGGYEGEETALRKGKFTLVLFAQNRTSGNSGMAQMKVRIR